MLAYVLDNICGWYELVVILIDQSLKLAVKSADF